MCVCALGVGKFSGGRGESRRGNKVSVLKQPEQQASESQKPVRTCSPFLVEALCPVPGHLCPPAYPLLSPICALWLLPALLGALSAQPRPCRKFSLQLPSAAGCFPCLFAHTPADRNLVPPCPLLAPSQQELCTWPCVVPSPSHLVFLRAHTHAHTQLLALGESFLSLSRWRGAGDAKPPTASESFQGGGGVAPGRDSRTKATLEFCSASSGLRGPGT